MRKILVMLLLSSAASTVTAAPREDWQRANYLALSSEVVVVAEVLLVERAPGHKGESGENIQDVRYRVAEVLKGETKATEFSVGFAIEFGVPFVELKESRLAPQIFEPGKRHVLFLKTDPAARPLEKSRLDGKPESNVAPDEHYGLAAADAETVRHLRQYISGAAHEDEEMVQSFERDAEIVVVAEIAEVKPSPNFWSGYITSSQGVNYRVIEVLKGNLKYPEISVDFLLFQRSPFVDPFAPRLLPEVFKPGNRQVHFLKRSEGGTYFEKAGGKLEAFSHFDHLWSVLADDDTLNFTRQLVLTRRDAKP